MGMHVLGSKYAPWVRDCCLKRLFDRVSCSGMRSFVTHVRNQEVFTASFSQLLTDCIELFCPNPI